MVRCPRRGTSCSFGKCCSARHSAAAEPDDAAQEDEEEGGPQGEGGQFGCPVQVVFAEDGVAVEHPVPGGVDYEGGDDDDSDSFGDYIAQEQGEEGEQGGEDGELAQFDSQVEGQQGG